MNKLLNISIFLVIVILISGCSKTSQVIPKKNQPTFKKKIKLDKYVYFIKKSNLKKINNIIYKAGKSAGWRMTKFKENALIAEKLHWNAVTIKFTQEYFTILPQNISLQKILKQAIKQELGE